MMKKIPGAAFLLLAAAACTAPSGPGKDIAPAVLEILEDRGGEEFALLSSYSQVSSFSDIYVLGSPEDCAFYSDNLTSCDRRDNVDGRHHPDGLPDFAGENIVSVRKSFGLDSASDSSEVAAMRNSMVNLVLRSLQRSYHMSDYDSDGLGEKAPAKIIILADPAADACCLPDLDSLFRGSGCAVELVSPIETALAASGKNLSRVGFAVADSLKDASFCRKALERLAPGAECFVADSCATAFPLRTFIDRSGLKGPLDCIIVLDPEVSALSCREDLSLISSVMNEEYLAYGKFIPAHFRCTIASEAVSDRCTDALRARNLFTHNVSFPTSDIYAVRPSPVEGEEDVLVQTRFVIPSANVQD